MKSKSKFGSVLDMFDKLDDIIYKPIELITNWATEPLKKMEHNRAKDLLRTESDIKINEIKEKADIREKERLNTVDLEIKKETEVFRIFTEIEEFKKDKELQRMQAISNAIILYQKELTQINTDAINAIGNMQLDLRNKAQNLVSEKTLRYKEMQKEATAEALNDFKQIEAECPDNEMMKDILIKSVGDRLANIIDAARNFIAELNRDISDINKNINLLTQSGQNFIERYLDKVSSIGYSQHQLHQISESTQENDRVII